MGWRSGTKLNPLFAHVHVVGLWVLREEEGWGLPLPQASLQILAYSITYICSTVVLFHCIMYRGSTALCSSVLCTEVLVCYAQRLHCIMYRGSTALCTYVLVYYVQRFWCIMHRCCTVLCTEVIVYYVQKFHCTMYRGSTVLCKEVPLYYVQRF
jgi:hypothetical protein